MPTRLPSAAAAARGRAAWLLGGLCALLPAVSGLGTEGAPAPDRLQVSIEFPAKGMKVGAVEGLDGHSLVTGRVLAFAGRLDLYEMVFVIDVSGSTAEPSGIDVDGDGSAGGTGGVVRRVFGSGKKAAADNILQAEIAAVRALLGELDPRTTRVGVVVFSGDDLQGTPDALVEVPLTSDYRRVGKGLDEIALVAPEGATNMGAGLRAALAQLKKPKPGPDGVEPQRFIVFLTDGEPMLGYKSTAEVGNEALDVARQAGKRGVQILSFAVGREASERSRYPSEMARLTKGRFVAVRDLNTLSTDVASVSFTKLAALTLRNRTLDAGPKCQILSPDGRFAALLPMQPGANAVEVRARSTLDTEQSAELSVELSPGTSLVSALDDAQREQLLRLRTICERPESQRGLDIQTDESQRKLDIETDE